MFGSFPNEVMKKKQHRNLWPLCVIYCCAGAVISRRRIFFSKHLWDGEEQKKQFYLASHFPSWCELKGAKERVAFKILS